MGERYVDEAGAEVLVTQAGERTLMVDDTVLNLAITAIAGVTLDTRAIARQIDQSCFAIRGTAELAPLQLARAGQGGDGHR